MPQPKRAIDNVARQNLLYLIEACAKARGSRGGQVHLAELLGTPSTHLSQLATGYKGRTVGRRLKTRIEQLFRLDDGWMDTVHGPEVVPKLVPTVPSRPPHPKTLPRDMAALCDEVAALREQIRDLRAAVEALVARLDQKDE